MNVSPRAVNHFELTPERLSFDARFHGVSRRISAPVGAIIGIYAKENQKGLFFPVEDEHGEKSDTEVATGEKVGSSNTIKFKAPE